MTVVLHKELVLYQTDLANRDLQDLRGSPTVGPAIKKIAAQWVPSHMGIQRNEKAHRRKKYAETLSTAALLTHARKPIRQKEDKAWLKEWKLRALPTQ